MSLHLLEVVPRDVAAESLGLVLDAPAPPALAERVLTDGAGSSLVLGVLGASHVVTATRGSHRITEQVSCDALGLGGVALPAERSDRGYHLTSTTTELTDAGLASLAHDLRTAAEHEPGWICGAFPGADTALTALSADPLPGGWTWRTWHLYPGEGRGVVVQTCSRWTP